jgi:hypothetical protein
MFDLAKRKCKTNPIDYRLLFVLIFFEAPCRKKRRLLQFCIHKSKEKRPIHRWQGFLSCANKQIALLFVGTGDCHNSAFFVLSSLLVLQPSSPPPHCVLSFLWRRHFRFLRKGSQLFRMPTTKCS